MKVTILVYVLTIVCVSYGQAVKREMSEEMKKKEEAASEVKRIGDESLQEKEPFKEDLDLWKVNNNNTPTVKLDNDFLVQERTKLGIIVVPDLPEKELEYRSQNVFETKDNVTATDKSIIPRKNNVFTEDDILTTVANLMEETATSTLLKLGSQNEEKFAQSLDNELKDILVTNTELPITVNPKSKPLPTVNKTLAINHTIVIKKNCTSKKTFPRSELEMVKRVYKEDHVNRLLAQESSLKKFERRTFNSWNSLDFGDKRHESVVKIAKEVPYPVPYPVEKKVPYPVKFVVDRPIPIEVPKPYPVTFEKNVFFPIREYIHAPYPVFRKLPYFIQISVDNPIPHHIPRPYPVYIEKKVPYPVEKPIPIPINIPVERPIPVHFPFVKNVYYPIEKKVRYPVHISVEKPVAVTVEKPYPIYIEKKVPAQVKEYFQNPIRVEDNKTKVDLNQNYNHQIEDGTFKLYPDHKTESIESQGSPQFEVNDGGFVNLGLSANGYDQTLRQKKIEDEPQESKTGEILQESVTTKLTLEKEITTEVYQDFGKKIKNV